MTLIIHGGHGPILLATGSKGTPGSSRPFKLAYHPAASIYPIRLGEGDSITEAMEMNKLFMQLRHTSTFLSLIKTRTQSWV
jgi:hypothetical protein